MSDIMNGPVMQLNKHPLCARHLLESVTNFTLTTAIHQGLLTPPISLRLREVNHKPRVTQPGWGRAKTGTQDCEFPYMLLLCCLCPSQ